RLGVLVVEDSAHSALPGPVIRVISQGWSATTVGGRAPGPVTPPRTARRRGSAGAAHSTSIRRVWQRRRSAPPHAPDAPRRTARPPLDRSVAGRRPWAGA